MKRKNNAKRIHKQHDNEYVNVESEESWKIKRKRSASHTRTKNAFN